MSERRAKFSERKEQRALETCLKKVEVLVDAHSFKEFSETKSSGFLKMVISNQSTIDTRFLKKT